jgi:hypothetical protein
MEMLLISGLVLLAAVLLWMVLRSRRETAEPRKKARPMEELDTLLSWHPQATRILTNFERKAYGTLRTALPDNIILAQVPLARFIKVPTRHSYAEWSRRVGAISADLLVCDMASQVIAVVEIRSPEGQESDRTRQRHERMDRVLEGAGIPLYVWRENALPSATVVRNLILKIPVEAPVESSPMGLDNKIPLRDLRTKNIPAEAMEPPTEDETSDMLDPPPSTWFDELNSGPATLSPTPPHPRGSGPSIR